MPPRRASSASAQNTWLRRDVGIALVLSLGAVLLVHVVWHRRRDAALLDGPSVVLGAGHTVALHRCRASPYRRQLWCTLRDGAVMSFLLRADTEDWIGHTVPRIGAPLSPTQDTLPGDRSPLRFHYGHADPALRKLAAWGPSSPYVWPPRADVTVTWGLNGWAAWPFTDAAE